MLRSIKSQKQTEHLRLWFADEYHDLFVWLDEDQQPIGFQFTYDKLHNEHSVSWHSDTGYAHDKVDSGEPIDGSFKMTPIMVPDGSFDKHKIADQFKAISEEIDQSLATFIFQKLVAFPNL